ncbi:MAG: polymer-forming cytoskeletal protein [Deltaproteobacteria bacterium]|nr:polymer-forming cytoskeletal protein [Deltaproteobacteria bacterium]
MRKKEKRSDSSVTTFLGSDARIEGTIEFDGAIRLDGKVEGKIKSRGGTVIVGEKAVINADINVGVAIIMGRVNGVVKADNRIEISPPGCVEGDIQAPVISIDAGVKFNGNCAMTTKTMSSKAPSKNIKPVPEIVSDPVFDNDEAKIKIFPKNL